MKIRYYYTDGRGQEHFDEHEVTMTLDGKTGQVYMSYYSTLYPGNNNTGYCGGNHFRGKRNSWRIVKESMTPEDKVMYGKFMAWWREYNLKSIRRNNADPCFPRHIGPVSDTVNGIGGTYHTLHCKACGRTWNIDSGD
jgi:hypothetical protein